MAVVTLNRPEARNALTPEMLCLLADAFTLVRADDAIRVAILAGTGHAAFCAGGDLGSTLPLMTGARQAQDAFERRMLADPAVLAASSLRDFPLHKPVIAAINGACLAAGFEMVLGTDIRVAAEHASFGLPEVQRALIPFAGSMVRLPRQIPYALAMEMLLTGRPMNAATALSCGLVNHVVPAGQVMDKAHEIASHIAANGPVAVRAVKQTVLEASGLPLDVGYRLEDRAKREVFASDDAREGPRSFMEKRAPLYAGR
ncbi:enoyl-CoA hydratase-related protein [Variovorax sp. J22R24]|uniref:enoyl-CoA hydratase-related protein n=1 Tax=Variovorax gracilis TaxID=3053502 RepID=UPI0025751201|nr:enoyl-CoA hydratase-related protein [Variovorax sp. J22R24]MDM0109254.1 enoyl-CoA hydratase-related protein [Variovorax sp. J22R24]